MKVTTIVWFGLSIALLAITEGAIAWGHIGAPVAFLGGYVSGASIALSAIQLHLERKAAK